MNKKVFLSTVVSTLLVSSLAYAKDRTLNEVLNNRSTFLAEKVDLLDLNGNHDLIKKELENCGFSLSGLQCLDSEISQNTSFGFNRLESVEDKSSFTIISLINDVKNKKTYVLVSKVNKDDKEPFLDDASIYEAKYQSRLDEVKKAYKKDNLKEILDIEVPADLLVLAEETIKSPGSLRELYHSSVILLKDENKKDVVKDSYSAHVSMFESDKSSKYQLKALNVVRDTFSNDQTFKKLIADKFITFKNQTVKELSAITLAEMGENSDAIKKLLVSSLDNSSWVIRKLGVLAFNNIKDGVDDENKIIAKLSDSDRDVRKAVISVVSKYELSNANLETLTTLGQDSSWGVRNQTVKFISKIDSLEATNELIKKLADTDSDVRKSAYSALGVRQVLAEHTPTLETLLSNNSWGVRKSAVQFLTKIKTVEARNMIISALADTDSDVRNTANQSLSNIQLDDSNVDSLSIVLGNGNWSVRRLAAKYLGNTKSKRALDILIDRLLVETDSDVKTEIKKSISKLK